METRSLPPADMQNYRRKNKPQRTALKKKKRMGSRLELWTSLLKSLKRPSNGDRSITSPSVSNKTKMHFHNWNHCALLSWSAPAFTQAQQSHRGWSRPMYLSSL